MIIQEIIEYKNENDPLQLLMKVERGSITNSHGLEILLLPENNTSKKQMIRVDPNYL